MGEDGHRPIRRASPSLARRGGRAIAASLPAPDLEGYSADHVAIAARAWTLRAEEEHRSAAVFAEIVAGCLDTGAPVDLVGAIARIVEDEVAHAALCLDLAARLGAPAPVASVDRVRARLAVHAGDRALQALSLLLFEGAVGESVSVRLFRAGRRAAREPCTRAALGAILRDEARHSTVCWLAAAELLTVLPAEARGALEQDLARSLGAFEQSAALPALQSLQAGRSVDPALRALGVLSYDDRVEAFYAGIERVVLPRLSRLGFDAQRLWAERYRTTRVEVDTVVAKEAISDPSKRPLRAFHPEGRFIGRDGPAAERGGYCNKKLCFVATDLDYLLRVLTELSDHEHCFWVKYSPEPKDGMYLGRCFMDDERLVGELWARFKDDPKLLCSVQDDDFTAPYRPRTE